MTAKSTSSTSYVRHSEHYGYGVNKTMENVGENPLRIEIRHLIEINYNLQPGEKKTVPVVGYLDIWFKSLNGKKVSLYVRNESFLDKKADTLITEFESLEFQEKVKAGIDELRLQKKYQVKSNHSYSETNINMILLFLTFLE